MHLRRCMRAVALVTVLTMSFSMAPASAATRATKTSSAPTIIPRSSWGADEELGIVTDAGKELERTEAAMRRQDAIDEETLSEREKRCSETLKDYPKEFKVASAVSEDEDGNPLVWTRQYSQKVKLIVIHHTGESRVSGIDDLTGPEQVRVIYRTHAVTNGWGDIGYHYLIDKNGAIYEGRAGGKRIIGAHVYCANTGTVGVALIGNFQFGYPSEEQLASLRQLLMQLGREYDIDIGGQTEFHGELMPTVVTHRDLAPTVCAGRFTQTLIPRILALAARGDIETALLPKNAKKMENIERDDRNILEAVGETSFRLPPRGTVNLQLKYRANANVVKSGEKIADIAQSDRTMMLWQKRSSGSFRVQKDLRASEQIPVGGSSIIRLTLLAPKKAGTYTVMIGEVRYTVTVVGR